MPPPALNEKPRRRRVVLVALGSTGDILPYVAIALGLRDRGHRVVIATSFCHRDKVDGHGLDFHCVRPDSDWVTNPAMMRRRSHPRLGLIRVAREWVLPALADTYEDTADAAGEADLLVSHPLAAFAVRLVAEKMRVPWVSTMLVPLGFFSAYDQTELPLPPILSAPFHRLSPRVRSWYLGLGSRATRFLARPWYRLRSQLQLPPVSDKNPLGDSHSPGLVLALFSQLMAQRQPDWPPQTVITGFPLSPRAGGAGLPPELNQFLGEGPPPLVFTLGTAVGSDPGRFYETSHAAAVALGHRAVLVGSGARAQIAANPTTITMDYVPYAELFPRAAVIVHHGGIGTTELALRSGRPMLVVPRAWDQPDNAARAARLGVARVLPARRYTASRVAHQLRSLLSGEYQQRTSVVRDQIAPEDGVRAACDAIEAYLKCARRAASEPPPPVG
jgi:UDP:flavonoid glycosyltransferase YjiC (YdhE family)